MGCHTATKGGFIGVGQARAGEAAIACMPNGPVVDSNGTWRLPGCVTEHRHRTDKEPIRFFEARNQPAQTPSHVARGLNHMVERLNHWANGSTAWLNDPTVWWSKITAWLNGPTAWCKGVAVWWSRGKTW